MTTEGRTVTMADITELRSDIRDLYTRLNESTKESNRLISDIRVELAKLTEVMQRFTPQERPCEQFRSLNEKVEEHLTDHKTTKKNWQSVFYGTATKVAGYVVVGVLSAFAANKLNK